MSFLELLVEVLDGWQNARTITAEPRDERVVGDLIDCLREEQLPRTQAAAEQLLSSMPALGTGQPAAESFGNWVEWPPHMPLFGFVEVSEVAEGCGTGIDLVETLTRTDDTAWAASGFLEMAGRSVSWVAGITREGSGPTHVLVFGPDSPLAYVIFASSEDELRDVIRAICAALKRAGSPEALGGEA